MTSSDVLKVLGALRAAGVAGKGIDGGWGVDALVGRQTREHTDLDLAIDGSLLDAVSSVLLDRGYVHDAGASPGLPARYAMRDSTEKRVDLHLLTFDAHGNGWQKLEDGDAWGYYPASEWTTGIIDGEEVNCISAQLQHRFYFGWEWDAKARHDMALLHDLFGLPLPPN
jgi:lincosamide nucleotidyltransferase A/C/D/E